MALDTYSGLKATVADFLNRTDLTAAIPGFITLAEAQINRRMMKDGPVRQMMARADATIDDEYVAVPTDFLGTRAIYMTDADPAYLLQYLDPEKMIDIKSRTVTPSGPPKNFSVVGSEFQFYPWAGGSYAGELTYWQKIPALSDTATSNWLLTDHPDIYLYAALLQSAPYLKDDERLAVWGRLFVEAINDLVVADRLARSAPHIAIPIPFGNAP